MAIPKSERKVAATERYDAFKKAAAEGYTRNEAGAQLGLSPSYARDWINNCAPDLIPQFAANARAKLRTVYVERAAHVVAHEIKGTPNNRMAQILGIRPSTLHNWRTRHRSELDALKKKYMQQCQQA